MNRIIVLFVFSSVFWSCKNDDADVAQPDPPRALSEVVSEDEAEIQEYLKTHYYNSEDFINPTEDFNYRVVVKKIPDGDTIKTPLSNQMESKTVHISSSDLSIDGDEQNIEHTIYFLKARQGVGENPTEVDSVFLRYEGSRLDGTVFDSSISNPVWLDLQGTLSQGNSGTIQGFKRGLPQFKSGGDIIVNDDGTFEVEGFGSGLLIFPSALGYYNGTNVGPAYSPIMFNIQVLVTNTADHDRDGTPTKDEVEIDDEGNVILTDSDGDGIPDYLDPNTK